MDGKKFNVHLDGYNMIPYFTGQAKESPRNAIVYFSDDGDVIAVRVGDWKFNLAVQRANTMRQWAEPFVKLAFAAYHELATRSVRTGGLQLEHLLGLDGRSRAAVVYDAGGRSPGRSRTSRSSRRARKPASFNLDAVLAQVQQPHG